MYPDRKRRNVNRHITPEVRSTEMVEDVKRTIVALAFETAVVEN